MIRRQTRHDRPLDPSTFQKTRMIVGALLLGICLILSGNAGAALIIQTIDQTVTSGNSLDIDVDQDGSYDFYINAVSAIKPRRIPQPSPRTPPREHRHRALWPC